MVDDSEFQLPVPSLRPDPAVLEIIENSKIKAFIGRLIVKAHAQNIRKIAILTWNVDEPVRMSAQILTVALSLQLDRKCALVLVEGIRFNCEVYETFSKVTLPEVPDQRLSEKAQEFVESMDKIFPFHILVGPMINDWEKQPKAKTQIALNADAQILLLPEDGLTRDAATQIEEFTKKYKLKWLGAIAIPNTGTQRNV